MKQAVFTGLILVLSILFFSPIVLGQETLLQEIDNATSLQSDSDSVVLPVYPFPLGYTEINRFGLVQKAGYDQIVYASENGKTVQLRLEESKDPLNMDDIRSYRIGDASEGIISVFPLLYSGKNNSGNFVAWESIPFFVEVIYNDELPVDFVQFFVDYFPPKKYGYGDRLLPSEKINLFYTSDDFVVPVDYGSMLSNSIESIIECNQEKSPFSGVELVTNSLQSANYPITSILVQEITDSCAKDGRFVKKPVPLPYDIVSCAKEVTSVFDDAGINFSDWEVSKECLIEKYSREKYLHGGGSDSTFNILISERRPKVVELLRVRDKPAVRCTETEDNEIINCVDINQKYEGTHEVTQDGEIFIETISDYEKFKEENAKSGDYRETYLVIDGREVLLREKISVQGGELIVNGESVGKFPEELDGDIIDAAKIERIVVSEDQQRGYEMDLVKPGKLLFLIPVDVRLNISVNSEDDIYRIVRPFWSFLVT